VGTGREGKRIIALKGVFLARPEKTPAFFWLDPKKRLVKISGVP
jgi:hypothetical protein